MKDDGSNFLASSQAQEDDASVVVFFSAQTSSDDGKNTHTKKQSHSHSIHPFVFASEQSVN